MRAAKRNRLAGGMPLGATQFRAPIAAGVALDENPNRVKRGAARLAYMDGFIAELQRAESRAYAPLTVSHPTLDRIGRRNPRARTSYTV